jgi:hypothetical protein
MFGLFFAVPSGKANAQQEALFRENSFSIYCAHSWNESVQYRSLQERSPAGFHESARGGVAAVQDQRTRSMGTLRRDFRTYSIVVLSALLAQRAVCTPRNADGRTAVAGPARRCFAKSLKKVRRSCTSKASKPLSVRV